MLPALECQDYKRAVAAAYRALKLVPRDEDLWRLLLQALLDAEVPPSRLLEAAKQAVTANPRVAFAHQVRIDAAYDCRDPAEVAKALESFLQRFGGKLSSGERREAEQYLAEARQRLAEREALAALAAQRRQAYQSRSRQRPATW